MHREQALGPVAAHPGQQDAGRGGADFLGHRQEQRIDAGLVTAHQRARTQAGVKAARRARHGHVAIVAGGHVDVARAQRHVRFGDQHPRRAGLVERLGDRRGEAGVDVLDDHGRRAIGGEGREHRVQRLDAAGR